MAIDPDFDRARINLIQLCVTTGDLEEALEHLTFLAKKFPKEPQLLIDIGTLRTQQGNTEEAARCYRKALELNPKLDEVRNRLETLESKSVLEEK